VELVAAALAQAKLRVKARSKFERAGSMYFTQAGLEQASSERMARHHASRRSLEWLTCAAASGAI
jgi:hypothetical protein